MSEARARGRKAALIAAELLSREVGSVAARWLPTTARNAVASAAGVRSPSDETWETALGVLEAAEDAKAKAAP